MIRNLGVNRLLWSAASIMVLLVTAIGVSSPSIYEGVIEADILPGVISQDIVAGGASIVVLLLVMTIRAPDYRKFIVIIGLLGTFFYAFGIYVIEQVYNWLYPLYLAIFSLSFFSIVHGLSSMRLSDFRGNSLPPWLRYLSAGYGIFVAIMFNFIWLNQLIPLLREGDRIEYLFSIFIIDLCFIMPAFFVTGLMTIRQRPLGEIGLPTLFVLGAGILSPLALAELIKPSPAVLAGTEAEFWLYFILTIIFLILAVLYLRNFKLTENPHIGSD